MEVRIDYGMELTYTEKKKIKWFVEEFDYQFGKIKTKNKFTSVQKKIANELLNNVVDYFTDITSPKVFDFFQIQLERIEKEYIALFK